MIQAYHAPVATRSDRCSSPIRAWNQPGSAALAGLEVVTIRSNPDGTVDVADVARIWTAGRRRS